MAGHQAASPRRNDGSDEYFNTDVWDPTTHAPLEGHQHWQRPGGRQGPQPPHTTTSNSSSAPEAGSPTGKPQLKRSPRNPGDSSSKATQLAMHPTPTIALDGAPPCPSTSRPGRSLHATHPAAGATTNLLYHNFHNLPQPPPSPPSYAPAPALASLPHHPLLATPAPACSTDAPPNWLQLHMDIWLNIIAHLPSPARRRLRRTSADLRTYVNLSTTALDFGDPAAPFFYSTPTALAPRCLHAVSRIRSPSPAYLPPSPSPLDTCLTTLELKTLPLNPPTPLLTYTALRTLKASRAPHGLPFATLPPCLTALHVRSIPAAHFPILPPPALAYSFPLLAHLDLPLAFPLGPTQLPFLAALPALTSLGAHNRITVDAYAGFQELATLTRLTRLSCTAAFGPHLLHLACLPALRHLDLSVLRSPQEDDWADLLLAIPGATSLSVHNGPTPLGGAQLLPLVAAVLPRLQALSLTSDNTDCNFAVHLPALGPASGLVALTHLTLRQATMQDPSLQEWLATLDAITAPPALKVLELESRASGYNLPAVAACPTVTSLSLVFPEHALDEAAAGALAELGQRRLTCLCLRTLITQPQLLTALCTEGLPRLLHLDLCAPRLSRMPLEALAQTLSVLPALQTLKVMMSMSAISSLHGINSLAHLATLTTLHTLQLRCCNSAEQAEVQQRVGQLAGHPSLHSLQVQLGSNLVKRATAQGAAFVAALREVALSTGSTTTILGVR